MNDNKKAESGRIAYFDFLRIAATFAVIIVHVCAKSWTDAGVNTYEWNVLNIYDSLARWSVVVFVMISGSLFITSNEPMKKIFTKNILRMIISYIVWSTFYYMVDGDGINKQLANLFNENAVNSFLAIIKGHYHMWYIIMVIGLYVSVPVLRLIGRDEKVCKYVLIISTIFCIIFPSLKMLAEDFGTGAFKEVYLGINSYWIAGSSSAVIAGYAFYFILGYYLDKTDFSLKNRVIIYALGFLGFVLTILLNVFASIKTGEAVSRYYGNFTINVFLSSVGMFVLFKSINFNNENLCRFFGTLSKYSFGAFLVHPFVIKCIDNVCGYKALTFNPVWNVLVLGLIVCVISFLISFVINLIPVIKKYIV